MSCKIISEEILVSVVIFAQVNLRFNIKPTVQFGHCTSKGGCIIQLASGQQHEVRVRQPGIDPP